MLRRQFLHGSAAALALATFGCSSTSGGRSSGEEDPQWLMPEEGDRHRGTWMAFCASEAIWGADLVPQVHRDLAAIANAISEFEPVSMLVNPADLDRAKRLVSADVDLVPARLDDLWMRDTGPVLVTNGQTVAGVDFNFNGWGDKQEHRRDAAVAKIVTTEADVRRLTTDLVLEGGALEVDGEGSALITESCVLNDNRNPGWSQADVEDELNRLLGIEKVIWLPGIAGKDITDGHTDFYARFAGPGVVVAGYDPDPESFDHEVTQKHLDILETATDAQGRELEVTVLDAPGTVRPEFESDDFAAGYINFYVCNDGVIAPQFGDAETDGRCLDELERLFPDRDVVQLNIDGIAAGGGGIHCTTQQEIVG